MASNMHSSLYESDFTDTDERDYSKSESETESIDSPKIKREKKPHVQEEKKNKILVSTSDDISIDDESVILLDNPKNCKITLPYLIGQESEKNKKGKIYTGKSITIMSKKKNFEHIISSAKGNYINGNSNFYCLKGGNSVVFHPIGTSWFADR